MNAPIEPRTGLGGGVYVAVGAAVVIVIAVATWPQFEAYRDRTSPARIAARAVAKGLSTHADTVGAVEVSGAELRLLGGALRFVLSEPRDGKEEAAMGHFHVVTSAAALPGASLEACLYAQGDSPEERVANVAEAFIGVALPPVFSHVKGEPMLGTRLAWGDEPWGVPGMRSHVGPLLWRGSVEDQSFAEAQLFADIPDLPRDGKAHLLKAVVYSTGGPWLRTVEIDGGPTAVAERPLADVEPSTAAGMIVRYAVYDGPASPPVPDGRDQALALLQAREAWLFTGEECPADVIPAALPDFSFSLTACGGGRLLDCLNECQRGAASFCYTAALDLQAAAVDPEGVQALYLRSCRLGYASGCTNAAAARTAGTSGMEACALRTFEQVCERSGDPWGCTMLGAALAMGKGTPADPARARQVLSRACAQDRSDPACRAAESILGKLDASRGGGS